MKDTKSKRPLTALPDARGNGFPTALLYRLSVEQYHDMIRQGILKDGDPVELLPHDDADRWGWESASYTPGRCMVWG